jgi:5'(3')-deoxyribonucleotidase
MDGVVADFVGGVLRRYNLEYNDHLTHADIKGHGMHNFMKCGTGVYKYFREEGLFAHLDVIKPAQQALLKLHNDGHDIYFVTKPVDHSHHCLREKQMWVTKHFPFIGLKKMVFTGQKHMVRGDVLIDDLPSNLEKFRGFKVLVDQPWNRVEVPPGIRFYNWGAIYETISAK